MRLCVVLLCRHLLEPVGFHVHVDRQVRAACTGRGAVPVLLARRDHDGVASLHFMRRFTPLLHPHAAFDDEEPLRPRMRMPVRPSTLVELHAIDVDRRPLLARREQLGLRWANERLGVGGTQGSGRAAKNVHGRTIIRAWEKSPLFWLACLRSYCRLPGTLSTQAGTSPPAGKSRRAR